MRAFAVGLAAVALLAGCGGGGSSNSGAPAGSIQVTMTEFKFDPSTITATHGKVVFWLINSGTTQHDLAIRDSSGNRIATSELVSSTRLGTTRHCAAASSWRFIANPTAPR